MTDNVGLFPIVFHKLSDLLKCGVSLPPVVMKASLWPDGQIGTDVLVKHKWDHHDV